jgi:phosphomannomutase
VACSIVSSQQLGRMAAAAGVAYEETLTGFKWIARVAGEDRRLVFGYEEALGYSVGGLVADKDGISALLAMVQRAAVLRAAGVSLLERLDQLSRQHGLHMTRQLSFRADGVAGVRRIADAMDRVRSSPPAELAGRAVTEVADLAAPAPGSSLPAANVVVMRLGDARAIVRPSGTEPKLKCYLEVVREVAPGADGLGVARAEAAAELDALAAAMTALLALE